MTTWVLIANASQAKIFSMNKPTFLAGKEKLLLLKELKHPESRKRDIELTSDKPGHYRSRGGAGHGSFIDPTDPKEYEAEVFARAVCQELEAGRVRNRYEELILVAPPHFHGLFNKQLHHPLAQLIVQVLEKDYTKDPEKTLEKHLLNQLK